MFKYVTLALLAITAIIVLFNLIKGLIRGFKKTIGTLVAIIISAVISAIVTAAICTPQSEIIAFIMENIESVFTGNQLQDIFGIEEIGETLTYYIAMIAAPFVFLALYVVISIIVSIIVGIIIRFIPPHKKMRGVLHRLGGLALGAVCGLLVSALLLMPVVGVINIAVSVGESELLGESDNEITEIVNEAADDKVYAVYAVCSGWMFDSMASTTFDGEKVYLKNEISVILAVVGNINALSGEVSEFDNTQIDALNNVVESLDKSALLKNTLAGILSEMASKWIAGETFMGIESIDAGELLNPLINSVLEVMASSEKDTITEDMSTLIGVLEVMVDHKLFDNVDSFESILEILSEKPDGEDGETAIEALINVANANPRMTKLSDEIATLSIRALASTLGIPENDDVTYNMLMDDIAAALNESKFDDDREAAVEEKIVEALDNYGVEVGGDAATYIAQGLIADFGDMNNVSGEAVKEFFMMYAAAKVDSSAESGYSGFGRLSSDDMIISTDPTVGKVRVGDYVFKYYNAYTYDTSAAFTSGKTGIDFEDAGTLYSAESMESNIVTLNDILNAQGVTRFTELSSEEAKAEAKKISDMLVLAGEMFGGNFSNPDYKLLIKDMGKVLDKMCEMRIFGWDATEKLLRAIFQSDDVRSSLGLPVHELDSHVQLIIDNARRDDSSYESVTKSVGGMLNMMEKVNDKNVTKEEKLEATKELMQDMTPANAELLSSMTTPDMMKDFVKSEEKVEPISNSVSSLFTNMAHFETDDDAEYEKEAEAVNTVLKLAMEGSESNNKAMFSSYDEDGNLVSEGKMDTTADEFISLVVNSSVVSKTVDDTVNGDEENPFGVTPSEDDEEEISNALVNHYDSEKDNLNEEEREELKQTLENIAKLTNIKTPEFN